MVNIGLAKVIPRAQLLREFNGGLDLKVSLMKIIINCRLALTRFGFLSLSYKTKQK